jgi:hypothetical protein
MRKEKLSDGKPCSNTNNAAREENTGSAYRTAAGFRTAKLIEGARRLIVKGGPHCITWTHAEEMNAELVNFLGERATKPQREVA